MFDTSATYGNEVLFHWVFRGYRSDADLSVQQQFCDEVLIRSANDGWFRPSIVISVFVGWKVSVTSFEVGARVYSIGPQGVVMASDHAMSTCELRVTDRASPEGYGNDADRVEFRFRDANNRIDLKCGRTSVPGTWLTVSHISGPSLINTIQQCRNQRARVEGPDHVQQQFAQLSAVIAPWYNDALANEGSTVGTFTDQFPVDEGNFHIRARSKLRVNPLMFVRQEALAHRSHDEGTELTARRGGPTCRSAAGIFDYLGSDEYADVCSADLYDQRVSVITPVLEGEEPPTDRVGEYIEEARDRLRADMRFSRTSAAITPVLYRSGGGDGTRAPGEQFDSNDGSAVFLSCLLALSRHHRAVPDGQLGAGGRGVKALDASSPDILRLLAKELGAGSGRNIKPADQPCFFRGTNVPSDPSARRSGAISRSVRKILSLPLFGDDFCQWLVDLRMAQFEKLCAVSDGTIAECVQAFVSLVPALEALHSPSTRKTEEELGRWVPTIEILFALVRSTAKTGWADLATDLGFGLAETTVATVRSPLRSKRGSDEPPMPLPLAKRPRTIEPRAEDAQVSLKARELGEARKWGMRLRAIVERCGEHAAIAGGPKPGSLLSQGEMNALRSIVFESGGFRTIQQCVRHWERLETWAKSQNIKAIPLTTEVLVKYLLNLSDRGCGPTVSPSVRGAVKWICKRFRSNQFVMAFFAWWILIMIYSSLRFDDAMHVVPEALAMKDEALRSGVADQ
ncbi:MSBP2, partial [Symbiodinium sp. CCMP2456]